MSGLGWFHPCFHRPPITSRSLFRAAVHGTLSKPYWATKKIKRRVDVTSRAYFQIIFGGRISISHSPCSDPPSSSTPPRARRFYARFAANANNRCNFPLLPLRFQPPSSPSGAANALGAPSGHHICPRKPQNELKVFEKFV